jgi:hypothetical protein
MLFTLHVRWIYTKCSAIYYILPRWRRRGGWLSQAMYLLQSSRKPPKPMVNLILQWKNQYPSDYRTLENIFPAERSLFKVPTNSQDSSSLHQTQDLPLSLTEDRGYPLHPKSKLGSNKKLHRHSSDFTKSLNKSIIRSTTLLSTS